jgi:uncharacterized membrane protein YkoI
VLNQKKFIYKGVTTMKLNKFIALGVIALLAIGLMGFFSSRSMAKGSVTPVQQAQVTQVTPGDQSAESPAQEEIANGPDTDNVEEQVGQQVEDNQTDTVGATGAESTGADEQTPNYAGSTTVDQSTAGASSEADESAALAAQAKITSEEAQTTALSANPGTTVAKAELDNENGTLVYSVELSNGSEVKVDAGTGTILHTETGGDSGD